MAGKRTIRITVERDRVWTIRQSRSVKRIWCERCAAEVEFISIEQAIALTGRTAEEIQHSVFAAKLHTASGGENVMRICLHSLIESGRSISSQEKSQ